MTKLVQLDANLIEEEPYNRLAPKIKDDRSGVTKFKYIRNVGNRFLSPPKCVGPGPVSSTHRFFAKYVIRITVNI